MKRWLALALAAVLAMSFLTACGSQETEEEGAGNAFRLRVCATARQESGDPAVASASGGDTVLYHLYENLLRWEDDGSGHAVLAPGIAESYTTEEDVSGAVTYTFTLRSDAKWSDGEDVTAEDFVYAYRRLFEMSDPPAAVAKLYMVEGYYQAKAEKDGSLLTGVSAPDGHTLVIKLTGHCAYFLDEFCAGTLTMPVREDMVEEYGGAWGQTASAVISTGPYRLRTISEESILVERNPYYYGEATGPDEIEFVWQTDAAADYEKLLSGEIDFLAGLPDSAVLEQQETGTLELEAVPSTYALLLNNAAAPFDNEFVRQAFAAVVDTAAVVEASGSPTVTAATGLVPPGISNRDDEWAVATETDTTTTDSEEVVLPEDLIEEAETGQEEETFWDYRAVGDYNLTEEELTAESRAARGRALLSQAGYPNGQNFPTVEYVYVDTPENEAVARYLQQLWQETLNVTVTLRAADEEEARSLLLGGEFTMAGFRFDAAYDDALAFLQRWQSSLGTAGGNVVSFSDRAYDLLLSVVSASSNSAREACLHDAEELLLQSKGVVPLFYYNTTSALADGLTGVYRRAMGAYFFDHVTAAEPAA